MTPEESATFFQHLPRNMVRNTMKIMDHEDAIHKLDPDHWDVTSLRTPSRRVRVYRRGDVIRCRVDKRNNQDQPCSHILAVMLYEGIVERPNTAAMVYQKGREGRNHALEGQAWREVPLKVPELLGRLLREGLPVIEPPLPPPGPGRPPAPLHALVYQAVMRVMWRQSLRSIQGSMNGANHHEHNPYGSVGAATLSRFLSNPDSTEVLEKLLALTTWPARPYETLVHPDGTGLTEQHFTSFFDEKYGDKNGGPRRHTWLFTEILWTYRYTMIAAIHSQKGPFGEAPWLIPLLERAGLMLDISELGGDKAYQAFYIFEYAARNGIEPQIKFKRNANPQGSSARKKAFKRTFEQAQLDPEGYAAKANRRNNAETGNAALKAILGDQVYSRNDVAQRNETLCIAVAYNLTRLVYLSLDQGIQIQFAGGAQVLARASWVPLPELRRTSTVAKSKTRRLR